jgi:hypothetical protein
MSYFPFLLAGLFDHVSQPLEGITSRASKITRYNIGVNGTNANRPSFKVVSHVDNFNLTGAMEVASKADIALVFASANSGEG